MKFFRVFYLFLGLIIATSCDEEKNEPNTNITPKFGLTGYQNVDQDYVSAQRELVNKAIETALVANKPVFVKIEGAWCPPCAELDHVIKNSEELKITLDQYEKVFIDEVFWETSRFYDFMPLKAKVQWFPSALLFDPVSQQWSPYYYLPMENTKALIGDLKHFAAEREFLQRHKEIMDQILTPEEIPEDQQEELSYATLNYIYNLSFRQGAKSALQAIKELTATLISKGLDPEDMGLSSTYTDITIHGTLADPVQVDEYIQLALDNQNKSNQESNQDPLSEVEKFKIIQKHEIAKIQNILVKGGVKEAASKCDQSFLAMEELLAKAESLDEVDADKKLNIKTLWQLGCLSLKRRLGDNKAAAKAKTIAEELLAKTDLEEKPLGAKNISRFFWISNSLDEAAEYLQIYANELNIRRQKTVDSLTTKLNESDNNIELKDELEIRINLKERQEKAYKLMIDRLKSGNDHPALAADGQR